MGVDTDDFSLHVEERTAGVTGVDGNVGLDERNELFVRKVTAFSGNNPRGDRIVQPEGGADSGHPFSDLDVIGFSQFYDGEVFAFNLDDGNIGFRIRTDDFSFKFTFISEVHGDFIGAVDDVIVCENDAVRIDDEAGTLAAAFGCHTRAVEIPEGERKTETAEHFKLLVRHAVLRSEALCFFNRRNTDDGFTVVLD